MTEPVPWSRLARYLAGESTPEEADEMRRWIEADPNRRRIVAELRTVWDASGSPPMAWNTPAAWERLAHRLHARERRERAVLTSVAWSGNETEGRSRSVRWIRVAVLALATLGGSALTWQLVTRKSPSTVPSPQLREVRTPLGERVQFQLSDGTRVLLGPGSILRYDTASFGLTARQLQLDGRAYFGVVHDPRRPFLVTTPRTVTQDLGTEFVITDYAGDPASEVVVASGTLAVRSTAADTSQSATVLSRGELARFDSSGLTAVHRGVNLTQQLAWTQGRLVFNDTPVADVITQLNRWYGGAVRLDDRRLARQRFTATYFSESLATALGEVATAIGAQVVHRGDSIILVPVSARSREK